MSRAGPRPSSRPARAAATEEAVGDDSPTPGTAPCQTNHCGLHDLSRVSFMLQSMAAPFRSLSNKLLQITQSWQGQLHAAFNSCSIKEPSLPPSAQLLGVVSVCWTNPCNCALFGPRPLNSLRSLAAFLEAAIPCLVRPPASLPPPLSFPTPPLTGATAAATALVAASAMLLVPPSLAAGPTNGAAAQQAMIESACEVVYDSQMAGSSEPRPADACKFLEESKGLSIVSVSAPALTDAKGADGSTPLGAILGLLGLGAAAASYSSQGKVPSLFPSHAVTTES